MKADFQQVKAQAEMPSRTASATGEEENAVRASLARMVSESLPET